MSAHYPRLRISANTGLLVVRECMSISFSMQREHRQVASLVIEAMEKYARIAGPQLGLYADDEGEWQDLDAAGWARVRKRMLDGPSANISLIDVSAREQRYRFEYRGHSLSQRLLPSDMSGMCFWLPTEYLEERGPAQVRVLAMELLGSLPICSGNVGLDYNAVPYLLGMRRVLPDLCLRYPGIDCWDFIDVAELGSRIWAPSWMTFIGHPTLGKVGGVDGLRAKLRTPGTTVEDVGGDRALVTLGEWPEAGDNRHGKGLPAYRELARVLEPWLFKDDRPHASGYFNDAADYQRWLRRFLD